MDDLIARIKAEGWHMELYYIPTYNIFVCGLIGADRIGHGRADSPEEAIIDAIREMDK